MHELGFSMSPPCTCEWAARGDLYSAEAVCCVFVHQYLDFISIRNPEWRTHLDSSSVYKRGFAPTGIVLSGMSPKAASRYVRAEPYSIVRCVDVDPATRITYEFLPLGHLGLPLGLVFDSAPDFLRRESPLSHPNTVLGIARVHLRVPSVDAALQQIAKAPLNLPSSNEIPIGTSRLHLYEARVDGYLGSVSDLLPNTARPTLLALEYSISSIETTSDVLRAQGVAFRSDGRSLSVDPEQGFGTGVIFSQSERSG
jgi:hypothetical protein